MIENTESCPFCGNETKAIPKNPNEIKRKVHLRANEVTRLAAKLNRLAALEAVCREIVEGAALEKHGSSFSTAFLKGSEVAERHIARKLKAVLDMCPITSASPGAIRWGIWDENKQDITNLRCG